MTPIRLLIALVLAMPALSAHACTVCGSSNGKQLRAGLFDGNFLHTALVVGAPIPAFAAAILLLHFGMPNLHRVEPATESIPLTLSKRAA